MYNLEIEKKQRYKLIAIAASLMIVIVFLVVAIVVVTNGKAGKNNIGGIDNGEFAMVEGDENAKSEEVVEGADNGEATEAENTETESTESENGSVIGAISTEISEGNENSAAESTPKEESSAETTDHLPKTGAEDLLPIALMLGMFTIWATSAVMAKREG